MKKGIFKNLLGCTLLTTLLLVSCGEANSQKENEEKKEESSEDKLDDDGQSLLWKISGNGLEQPSYLYGTMHMISKEHFVMGAQMKSKLEQSDALVMEVEDIMSASLKSMNLMKLDSGHVSDYFTPAQYDSVLTWAEEEMGIDKETFDTKFGQMKPFMILQLVTQQQFEGPTKSYELEFIKMANEADLEMLGLETIEQQIGFFDEIPKEKMADLLLKSIRDQEEADHMTDDLTRLYYEQKTDSLLTFMLKSSPEMMEFENLLLYDRNKAWIPKIEKIIKEQQAFIAVGAAHLFGENGVIDLLEKKGYKVTPLATD